MDSRFRSHPVLTCVVVATSAVCGIAVVSAQTRGRKPAPATPAAAPAKPRPKGDTEIKIDKVVPQAGRLELRFEATCRKYRGRANIGRNQWAVEIKPLGEEQVIYTHLWEPFDPAVRDLTDKFEARIPLQPGRYMAVVSLRNLSPVAHNGVIVSNYFMISARTIHFEVK